MCVLVNNGILRTMEATRKSSCPYCEGDILTGDIIMGDYGIRWGHVACVKDAYEQAKLILSGNNVEKMNSKLLPLTLPGSATTVRLRDRFNQVKKKKAPKAWTDEWMGKPEHVCQFFPPQRIEVVSLPEAMKLSPGVAKELGSYETGKAEEKIWDQFLEKWIAEYRRSLKSYPFCPVHQWSHDPADHLQIKVTLLDGNKFGPQRALWWFCPAARK